mmetsp:Transcript_83002/g.165707  ORF Transcript_83002/g.165707 Transcript_83002/m.165707 type:complete len:236 (+) Transcript_83002:35-742(+)
MARRDVDRAAYPCSVERGDDGSFTLTLPCTPAESRSLPDILQRMLPQLFPSSSAAKRACRNKGGKYSVVLGDGREGRCASELAPGDTLRVVPILKALPQLKVVWSDADVMVVHKPAGVPMHGDAEKSLVYRLRGEATPCHRLDAPTEGLVICGRNQQAISNITEQFEQRAVHKVYRAVVHVPGSSRLCSPVSDGVVDSPIDGRAYPRCHPNQRLALLCPSPPSSAHLPLLHCLSH